MHRHCEPLQRLAPFRVQHSTEQKYTHNYLALQCKVRNKLGKYQLKLSSPQERYSRVFGRSSCRKFHLAPTQCRVCRAIGSQQVTTTNSSVARWEATKEGGGGGRGWRWIPPVVFYVPTSANGWGNRGQRDCLRNDGDGMFIRSTSKQAHDSLRRVGKTGTGRPELQQQEQQQPPKRRRQ